MTKDVKTATGLEEALTKIKELLKNVMLIPDILKYLRGRQVPGMLAKSLKARVWADPEER